MQGKVMKRLKEIFFNFMCRNDMHIMEHNYKSGEAYNSKTSKKIGDIHLFSCKHCDKKDFSVQLLDGTWESAKI